MSKSKHTLPANYDKAKSYSVKSALELLPQLSTSKFVGSVDVDIVLNISEKQKKESLRGSASLPHSFGIPPKIIVFAGEKESQQALKAGAVAAGLEKLLVEVEKGEVEYDIVVATPDVMAQIAKLGKVLGPKGLMPNPTNGTVTKDVEATISSFQSGKQSFKMSDQGVVRGKIGKLDMETDKLVDNLLTYVTAVMAEAKKFNSQPLKKITISPTMGSGVKLDLSEIVEKA